jgi:cytochrome c553
MTKNIPARQSKQIPLLPPQDQAEDLLAKASSDLLTRLSRGVESFVGNPRSPLLEPERSARLFEQIKSDCRPNNMTPWPTCATSARRAQLFAQERMQRWLHGWLPFTCHCRWPRRPRRGARRDDPALLILGSFTLDQAAGPTPIGNTSKNHILINLAKATRLGSPDRKRVGGSLGLFAVNRLVWSKGHVSPSHAFIEVRGVPTAEAAATKAVVRDRGRPSIGRSDEVPRSTPGNGPITNAACSTCHRPEASRRTAARADVRLVPPRAPSAQGNGHPLTSCHASLQGPSGQIDVATAITGFPQGHVEFRAVASGRIPRACSQPRRTSGGSSRAERAMRSPASRVMRRNRRGEVSRRSEYDTHCARCHRLRSTTTSASRAPSYPR